MCDYGPGYGLLVDSVETAMNERWENFYTRQVTTSIIRAISQAVSRWLSTAAARVGARVWSCGGCGGQSGAGVGFIRVLRSPLPIFIPQLAAQSPSSVIWGWYNGPVVVAVPSWLSLTPLRNTISISRKILIGGIVCYLVLTHFCCNRS
jgi:hypothetical protein